MEKVKLTATPREVTGKQVGALRRQGLIPAVVYGQGQKNQNLTVVKGEFEKILREVGTSSIILLSIEGDGQKNVLVHEIGHNPLTGDSDHIDFYEISMKEKITTTIPLHFVGDSSAVIELGGTLVTNKDEIEVECLPGDLPPGIEVDITPLVDFEAEIRVSDLKIPEGVEVKDEAEEMVATVEPPRSEEELAELEETPEAPEMPESEHGGEEGEAEGEPGEEKPE
jgi:large subunit ribosomal protein L25